MFERVRRVKRSPTNLLAESPKLANFALSARISEADWVVEAPPGASLRGDALGRWQAARIRGTLYRRLLDGGVVCQEDQRRAPADVVSPARVYAQVAGLARELEQAIGDPAVPLQGPGADSRSDLGAALGRCARRAAGGPEPERATYDAAYPEPVEILPPDRYRDVVLLPAVGCPSARCSFCTFYRDRPFRPFSRSRLRAHAEAVSRFLGPARRLRDGLFLGSASAMSLSQMRLVEALTIAQQTFGVLPRGAAAFWDPDHSPRREADQWKDLAQLSLRAVYVGLETGLPGLRQSVGKSGAVERLIALVSAARTAVPAEALRLGVIVMVGLGGSTLVEDHRRATVATVARLPLAPSDLVYLSPLVGGLEPQALASETERLREALRAVTAARVVPYAMDRFRHYA